MENPFNTISKENTPQFTHFISLGHFCSVAMELERYGFRNASYPFDWLVTPRFDSVIEAIDSHFEGFLDYDALEQDSFKRQIYYNHCCHCSFVHDFDRYTPLSQQMAAVSEKYKRRIDRFYTDIASPTLFVRYINDEGIDTQNTRSSEIVWIENNLDRIYDCIRHDNPNNDILWIANEGVVSDYIHIYNVEKDPNDNVARRPFEKNPELGTLFDNFDIPGREQNLQRYLNKENKKKSLSHRVLSKTSETIRKVVLREYIHDANNTKPE